MKLRQTRTTSTELDTLPEGDFRYLVCAFDPIGAQNAYLKIIVDNGTTTLPGLFPTATTEVVVDDLNDAGGFEQLFRQLVCECYDRSNLFTFLFIFRRYDVGPNSHRRWLVTSGFAEITLVLGYAN